MINPQGNPRGGLAGYMESLVPRWAGRPDTEHEQALLRLMVGLLAAAYLLNLLIDAPGPISLLDPRIFCIIVFLILTIAIFCWLYLNPGISVPRRLLGAITDMSATSVAIYLYGNMATPLFTIYLWVTFGNGFRFGQAYLLFSMLLALSGYSLVVWLSPHWDLPDHVTAGLFIGLLVLPIYVSALLRRLTEALRNAQTASVAKSNFLATMSHEIRTPLSGIVGVISLLKRYSLDASQQRYLKIIEESTNWLSRVLSDGLDYSKIEAGELIVERRPFHLPQAMTEVATIFERLADVRGLEFICHLDENLPIGVVGDRMKLVQVLNNLLSNACKFTEQGTIVLRVSCIARQQEQVRLGFYISDTGIGIPSTHLSRIFTPFHQVDATMSRSKEGSGLGLAVAAKLVALFGSSIEADSQVGKGSVFSFELKLPLASAEETATLASGDGAAPHWQKKPHLLLVEDNSTNQEVLTHLLTVLDCQVEVAENGRMGVEMALAGIYDLIFMDCQMPIMDGYQATREIHKTRKPDLPSPPVIALTAHVTVADREACRRAGMDDYLGKPCDLTDLRVILVKWLPHLLEGDQLPLPPLPTATTHSLAPPQQPSANRRYIHDLRNCYTKIMGNAEILLLAKLPPEEVNERLKTILAEIKEANRITQKIM